jgi:hypothetical protein
LVVGACLWHVESVPRLRSFGLALCALSTSCYPPIDDLVSDEPPIGGERSCTLPSQPDIAPPTSLPESAFPRLTGASHPVAPGDDLQAVIDSAERGDEIVLQAGAEYPGPLRLPYKPGSGAIVIRSSALGQLSEGRRVALEDAPRLATILASESEPAIEALERAEGYRLAGLDLRPASGNAADVLLVVGSSASTLPEALPTEIVIDRSLVRGDPELGARTGIQLASRAAAIVDSMITDVKTTSGESQGLAIRSAVGPILVYNTAIEAAWQNIAIGEYSPGSAELFPSDIAICKSLLEKPASWQTEAWTIKALIEIRRGRRVLLSDTELLRSWEATHQGYGITVADEGGAGGLFTEDIAVVNVRIRQVHTAFHVTTSDASIRRVLVENSELTQVGNRLIQVFGGGVQDLRFIHVTGQAPHSMLMADGAPSSGLMLRDGLFYAGTYGIFGSGMGSGTSALDAYFPGWIVAGNVLIGANASSYPPNNFFPPSFFEAGVVDADAGNFRLSPDSPFAGKATDGKDPGADIDALEAALAPR